MYFNGHNGSIDDQCTVKGRACSDDPTEKCHLTAKVLGFTEYESIFFNYYFFFYS